METLISSCACGDDHSEKILIEGLPGDFVSPNIFQQKTYARGQMIDTSSPEACPHSDHRVPVNSNESVPVPPAPRIFSVDPKNSASYHNGATGPPPPPPLVKSPAVNQKMRTEGNSASIATKAPWTKGLQLSQQEELKLKVAERRRRMKNDSEDDSS